MWEIRPESSSLFLQPITSIQRYFSTRRNNTKSNKNKSSDAILANERLIQFLMKQPEPQSSQLQNSHSNHDAFNSNNNKITTSNNTTTNNKDPTNVQVRLVMDEGYDKPATVQICTLADAIAISVERNVDLIGMSLTSEPPVIRAAQLSKLEYRKEQQLQQQQQKQKQEEKKTFRFRAGIDSHDLERKIQDMIKALQKGSECEYTVFSKARTLRVNENAGMELVNRIQGLIQHVGELKKQPQVNEDGNFVRVQLVPKK